MGEIGREREITHVDHDFLSDLIAGWGVCISMWKSGVTDGPRSTHIHDSDAGPEGLFHGLIVLLVVPDAVVVVLDGFLGIPSAVLGRW